MLVLISAIKSSVIKRKVAFKWILKRMQEVARLYTRRGLKAEGTSKENKVPNSKIKCSRSIE